MWPFDLIYQRHLVDGWMCLIVTYKPLAMRFLDHHILDMAWSPRRWFCDQDEIVSPQYLSRLTQGMRCDEILDQSSENIREVPNDFLH